MTIEPTTPRRFVSLGTKLAGLTLGLLVLVAGAVFFQLRAHEREKSLAAKETAALMVARLFAANVSAPLTFGDDKGVNESVATLAANEEVGYGAAWSLEGEKLGPQLGELRRTSATFAPPAAIPTAIAATRGADWIVVDGPVLDPTGKVVGVSRVALSLAAEHAAIAAMQRRILLASIGVALAFGVVLLAFSRILIVRPLGVLAKAARRLEAGEHVKVDQEADDETGLLARAFARMADAIAAREQRISERNRDMRLVLDNVEDGFLSVDRDGVLSDERSGIVDRWFGAPARGATVFDYLEPAAPLASQWLRLGWETILEDVLPLELAIDQLPKHFTHEERHFELRYRPLLDGETFTGMLVVVSDATPKVERERSEAGQREMLAIFRRMLADRNAFGEFLEECGALVDAIAAQDGDVVTLKRQIHTLKGNTALYGVETVSKLCHELESRMIDGDERPDSKALAELKGIWTGLLQRCGELGWQADAPTLHVDLGDVRELLKAVRSGAERTEIARTVAAWALEPAGARLKRIAEQLEALAPRLGKPVPAIEIEPSKLRIPSKKWAPVLSSLAHVVRNTVDHGLETEDERAASGKPAPARIWLSLTEQGGEVALAIRDDGRGIDWEKLRARARAAGLPSETQADLEEALYADSVSTRDVATATSGRGVGMSAVRAAVRAAGGRIEVESRLGEGTTFRFLLPAAMLVSDEPLRRSSMPPRGNGKISVRPAPYAPLGDLAGVRP